jgi:NAD(P)-dependent dehydrogenase (short-subunit alcohol dehydrogenase family)
MKSALVTGGNRGIGLEICRQLNARGFRVILCSRDLEKGLAAAESIGKNVVARQLDITNEVSIQRLFEYLKLENGNLDVLINNAGIGESSWGKKEKTLLGSTKEFLEDNVYGVRQIRKAIVPHLRKAGILSKRAGAGSADLREVRRIMETNLYGAWRMIQVFAPLLEKSDDARIINISSGLGELGSLTGEYPAYSASKAALNAMTIMFANELSKSGIRVNAVCPGWVKTDMGGQDAPLDVSQGADTAVWLATEPDMPTGRFFRERKEIHW